jgi:hypothetical protein
MFKRMLDRRFTEIELKRMLVRGDWMKEPYLEVTYRRGKAIAAYYYLPRGPRDKSHRVSRPAPGLIVDYTRSGKPIAIEITAPGRVSTTGLNHLLRELGFAPASRAELSPLRAA